MNKKDHFKVGVDAPQILQFQGKSLYACAEPGLSLADYRLAVQPISEFELVAGAERGDDRADGAARWSTPFPLDGLVLLGGPLERSSRQHGDVKLHAVLAPGKKEVAQDILDASAEYLDRYYGGYL